MQTSDQGLYPLLLSVPVETVPLYAALALMRQSGLDHRPAATCVTTCTILARTLGHLGFRAEPMPACVTVLRVKTKATVAVVGVREHPLVRPDGTTAGYMVLWAESFNQLVDPSLVHEPALRAAADEAVQSFPGIVPVPSTKSQLSSRAVATTWEPLIISWALFPKWTPALDTVLDDAVVDAVNHGALDLAHRLVEQLRFFAGIRNLHSLYDAYPRLADLLTGTAQLPALP